MSFGVKEIKDLLERYRPTSFEYGTGGSRLSVATLSAVSAALDSDVIYIVAAPNDLSRVFQTEGLCAVMCFPAESVSYDLDEQCKTKCLDLIFLASSPEPEYIHTVVSAALKENNLLAQFSKDLLHLLYHDGTVQMMVDLAFKYIGRTICVFDTSLKLFAATWDNPNKEENSERIFKNRFLDNEDLVSMNYDNLHERVKKSPVPLLVQQKRFKGDRIISMINTKKDIGHFVIFSEDHPLREIDLKLAELLRNSIDQQMKKDEFVQHAKGFNYEWFLKDLLDGKNVFGSGSSKRHANLDKEFAGPLYCLVVEITRTPGAVSLDHIRSGFEAMLPGISTIIYNGQIVVVVSGKNKNTLSSEDISNIGKYCMANDLFCGMSNSFMSIAQLPEYYKQALNAIQEGAGENSASGLFAYNKYFIKHVASIFLKTEKAETFCCPQMKHLIEYDKVKGKELAKTLYMYLLCGNACSAASAMFIHRNTMLYRLGLINELVSIDYNDPHLRQYLILSYEIMTLN